MIDPTEFNQVSKAIRHNKRCRNCTKFVKADELFCDSYCEWEFDCSEEFEQQKEDAIRPTFIPCFDIRNGG